MARVPKFGHIFFGQLACNFLWELRINPIIMLIFHFWRPLLAGNGRDRHARPEVGPLGRPFVFWAAPIAISRNYVFEIFRDDRF